jgi:nicotinate-nucleotide adenylyltransferase
LRRIGIYGGTFDPIHIGHLILAREAREQLELERVILVPTALSPFKKPPHASAEARLTMLRAAVEGETAFTVDDCELRRPPPSYTIDTVLQIREQKPSADICLLIGEDNVADLNKWHRFSELEKLVHFVVLDRGSVQAEGGYDVVRRKIDISATDIRQRIASGRSIRYLVPPAVEEIIRRENLYRGSAK